MKHQENSPAPPLDLVTVVASAGDLGLLAVAESLLQSAAIPYVRRGDEAALVGSAANPIEIQVRATDAEDARLLLKDLWDSAEDSRTP